MQDKLYNIRNWLLYATVLCLIASTPDVHSYGASQAVSTVWPKILAGRYFGGLLKICHLAVEPVFAIVIFIAKWLIELTGNLTGPWASFRSVRTKSMINCNWKLNNLCYAKSGLFSSCWSLQRSRTRRLDRLPLPRIDRQANSFPSVYKPFWRSNVLVCSFQW